MCYGSKTGYSTAVAMIMFLIVLIPVLISLRLTRTRD
jgi:raffinose/stachyose/melibiose transport system permease protein